MAVIERRVQAIADSGVKRHDPLGVGLAVLLVLVAALGVSLGFQSDGVLRGCLVHLRRGDWGDWCLRVYPIRCQL
jgi:hypothetical protein